MSLRARVTLLSTAVATSVIVLFGALAFFAARSTAAAQQDEVLAQVATQSARRVTQFDPTALRRASVATTVDVAASSAEFVEVFDSSGTAVYSSGLIDGSRVAVPAQTLREAGDPAHPVSTAVVVSGVPIRLSILPIANLGPRAGGWVVAGASTIAVQEAFDRLRRFLAVIALVLLAGGAASLWWLTRRTLRPLGFAAATAEAVRQDRDLSRRLPPAPHRDEVGRLVSSFNGMIEELERTHHDLDSALATQRRFVADASHELRTPLTSIRSNIEFVRVHASASDADRAAAMADIEAETARMARMVDDLLTLARADAGQRLELAPVDLGPVMERLARQATLVYRHRRVVLRIDGAARVSGNADALAQLGWILVDNAARHTTEGGTIAVDLRCSATDVVIEVSDDGVGIPAADLPHIFERFYQADSSRRGGRAGLGLSIAAWIIGEHHGTIEATGNAPRGARVVARIPLSASS